MDDIQKKKCKIEFSYMDLKVTEEELNDIVHKWTDVNINYNGDKNELEC